MYIIHRVHHTICCYIYVLYMHLSTTAIKRTTNNSATEAHGMFVHFAGDKLSCCQPSVKTLLVKCPSVQWQPDGLTIHHNKLFLGAGFLGALPIALNYYYYYYYHLLLLLLLATVGRDRASAGGTICTILLLRLLYVHLRVLVIPAAAGLARQRRGRPGWTCTQIAARARYLSCSELFCLGSKSIASLIHMQTQRL
jgi:hypothetical protein